MHLTWIIIVRSRKSIDFDVRKTNEFCLDHIYALYDYDGTMNNGNSRTAGNRFGDRHIKVNEGDKLEILEDDDEHVWKVREESIRMDFAWMICF